MATKRKTSKRQTKKDLEAKIAQLEAKLAGLSAKAGGTAQTKAPPPPPPKPAEQKAAPPKPAEKAGVPATLGEALEDAWRNYPMGTSPTIMKAKVTGFIPNCNRYVGRRIAPVGTVQTYDWNLQKEKVTGYTACSNQYYATRARMAYHPHDKSFTGYGMQVQGIAKQQTQSAPPPPPPQPEPQPQQASSGGSGKQSSLEAYENEYLARLDRQAQEQDELMQAAAELAAKRKGQASSDSGQASSKKGSLPKGF
jgi:hypothetical protein